MMTKLHALWLIPLLMIFSACGSSPHSDYYMLTADAQGIPGDEGPALGVGPVTIPEYLKTRQIVLNRNAHLLKLAEFDRWAEPLDAGVRRVVAVNLAVMLDTSEVQIFPWRRDAIPEYAVRINIVQFAAQDNEAMLVAEWAITRPREGESGARAISRLTTDINSAEPEQVAGAYSNLLYQLSEVISAALQKEIAGNEG